MSTMNNPDSNEPGSKKPAIFIPPEKRCAHRTESGSPCRAARWRASQFCIFHDPNFRKLRKHLDERREAAAQRTPMRTPEGIHQMLEDAARDVREKKISSSEAGIIGYLAQVMISNLKNLPHAEDPNTLTPSLKDHYMHRTVDVILETVNEELARWMPHSSPVAVARAEQDMVRLAADASAKEAARAAAQSAGARAAEPSAPAPAAEQSPAPSKAPERPWAGFDGTSLGALGVAAKKRYCP